MSQKIPILVLTVTAVGAVSAHRFVGYDGAQISVASARTFGAADSKAADGDDYAVDVLGTTVVETAGAIAVGDDVVADATGAAIVNPALGGEHIAGQALDSAAGAGEFIEVLLAR